MFQNHILQLMMITAMEPPARYDSSLVRDEKVKVLHSVRKMAGADFASNTVRGQYEGYLQEEGVPPGSQTETFAGLNCIATIGDGRAFRSIFAVVKGCLAERRRS